MIVQTRASPAGTEYWNSSAKKKPQVLGVCGVIGEQSRTQSSSFACSLLYWWGMDSKEQTPVCGSGSLPFWYGMRAACIQWVGRNSSILRSICTDHTWKDGGIKRSPQKLFNWQDLPQGLVLTSKEGLITQRGLRLGCDLPLRNSSHLSPEAVVRLRQGCDGDPPEMGSGFVS